jgi:hypothetical protein
MLFWSLSAISQNEVINTIQTDSVKGTWDLNLDIASRYIWRGQSFGGDFPVTQVYGKYNFSKKWSVGMWTTHNFKKEYYDTNGTTKGYQEFDFILNYAINDFCTISLQDYYWPSTDRQDGVSNNFFNYGNNSSQTIDLMLMFDFTERGLPLSFTTSTFLAGNDFKFKDELDEKGKQNYTTYLEVGYTIEAPHQISIAPILGVVLNNQAKYYTYSDYDKPSFVNLGCKVSKEFKLSESIIMLVRLNYSYNAANTRENFGLLGHQFLVAGITFTVSK